jgi:hypothetical protein
MKKWSFGLHDLEEKIFSTTLKALISQTLRSECVRFNGGIGIEELKSYG